MWKVTEPTGALWFSVREYEINALHKSIVKHLKDKVKKSPERYPFKPPLLKDIFFKPQGTDRVTVHHREVPHHLLCKAVWDSKIIDSESEGG